jgi:hypothetical protein
MTAEKTASAVFFDVMENAPQGVQPCFRYFRRSVELWMQSSVVRYKPFSPSL